MSKDVREPEKRKKPDDEYQPSNHESGSSSVELYSDEFEGEDIDLQAYLKDRDRLIAEEQAEEQAGSEVSEGSSEESQSSSESEERPVRGKRPRKQSSSSSE